ncbi:hypothetical protein [Pyruvatibacter sp.]
MERLHQDREFTVESIVGSRLSKMIACYDDDKDAGNPIVFYAQFSNESNWHKFFLDLSAAFWDLLPTDDIIDEFQDEGYRFDTILEDMTNQIVVDAFAFVPDGTECAGIDIVFSDGCRFVIRCVHDDNGHHTEAKQIR